METIIQSTHPKAVAMMGGVDELRSQFEAAASKSKSSGITHGPVEFIRSPEFLSTPSNEFAIVHVRLTAAKDATRMTRDTYLLAVRPPGHQEWKYIDGTSLTADIVREMFSDFPVNYRLPQSTLQER